jgi:phosphohistidine phosphatase
MVKMEWKSFLVRISIGIAIFFGLWIGLMSIQSDETVEEPGHKLYILRHAKSDKSDPSLKDFDRPLNKRGFMDAPLMGAVLATKNVKIDLIVASPSKRTHQTIIPIALAIGYDTNDIVWNKKIYRCSFSGYMEEVEKISDKNYNVMIVGHNGATTGVANMLQKDSLIANVSTAGVVAINFGSTSWKEVRQKKGKLIFFDVPKNHK